MAYYVYVMSNRPDGTFYIGVTNDLPRRIHEHRTNAVEGFTSRYNLHHLVFFEEHATAYAAIQREKNLKHWSRAWKVDLIETTNPSWREPILRGAICTTIFLPPE